MKKNLILIIVLVIVLAGAYFMRQSVLKSAKVEVIESTAVYSSPELGFEFTYKNGENGYVVAEMPNDPNNKNFLKTIILMQAEDVKNITNIPEGGEGPPIMAVLVFKNTKKQFPLAWAQANIQFSNFNLKRGEVTEIVVGGANAIRYMSDGLYASDVVIVAHGENIYVLAGMYIDVVSALRQDFEPLVQSIKFIPSSGQE